MKGEASVEGVHLQTKIANLLSGLDAALYMVASAMVDYSVSQLVIKLSVECIFYSVQTLLHTGGWYSKQFEGMV